MAKLLHLEASQRFALNIEVQKRDPIHKVKFQHREPKVLLAYGEAKAFPFLSIVPLIRR